MPTKNVACAVDILGQPTPTPSYTTFPETAVVLVNARGQVTGASDEGRSLLGLNTENQSLPPVLREMLREALSSGNTTTSREIVLESRPSMAVEVTIQCLPDATAEHRLAIIISAVRSPSDPEQELRRLHRLASAGTLSAGIAHEIKNALVAGKTFLELLLEKHEDAELVGIVRREMDRIDSLVTQMLKFSRP